MSPFSSEEFVRQRVRSLQIIIFALAMGLFMFAGIAVMTRLNRQPLNAQPGADILPIVAVVSAVAILAARAVFPGVIVAAQRRQIAAGTWQARPNPSESGLPPAASDGDRLLTVYQATQIIKAALLEGPGFFTLIVYIVSGVQWLLAVVAALMGLLILQFPTRDRVETWVAYQLELMEFDKQQPQS